MTVKETFDNFILSRELSNLSRKTILDYTQFVSPFVAFVGSEKDFSTLTQEDINKYISNIVKRPLSSSTKATYIRHIKIYLKYCQEEYSVCYDAKKIKVPKSPKREVRIYTNDEVKQIFASVQAESEWIVARNKTIIALMYDSGLRQSEVCTLLHKNISFNGKLITVRGKGDKERVVPIGNLTLYYLEQYIALCPYRESNVFVTRQGGILTNNAVKLMISKIADKVPFSLSSHKLRHNFATNYCLNQYEKNGSVDVYRLMYLMGHEDIETTQRYLHFANEILASKNCISHLDNIYV